MPKAYLLLFTAWILLWTPAAACPTAQAGELGRGVAAASDEAALTFAEFDQAALWRHALTQDGRAALRQLLELRLLRQMMAEQGVEISAERLAAKWRELDEQTRQTGEKGGLEAHLVKEGIPSGLFQRYLELSMAQELLARRALGIRKDNPVTSEQQVSWLEGEIKLRTYSEEQHPWSGGVVARCGDITIGTREYLAHLREQLRNKDSKRLCFDLLLAKELRARMPDLSDAALERVVEDEMKKRRTEKENDPRYKGLPYPELLKAKGLSIEAVRRDPAIRSAALAQLWVERGIEEDRTRDSERGDRLRTTYEAEREHFDGRYGEAIEIFAIVLKAAVYKNELNTRTFNEADAMLAEMDAGMTAVDASPRRLRLEEFQALVLQHSEDRQSRDQAGSLGVTRQHSRTVPDLVLRETSPS
ncbi:MAG: hypothetical protein ACI835_003553 [Planctomycetota bacterium]|jgi:hypothetical protein